MSYQTYRLYWGVARFIYILGTNANPVTTSASDGRVNPYRNILRACLRTGMLQVLRYK